MTITINDLRADWLRAIELYSEQINYLENGNMIRPAAASADQVAKATNEWLEQMRRWRKQLEDLLNVYPAQD